MSSLNPSGGTQIHGMPAAVELLLLLLHWKLIIVVLQPGCDSSAALCFGVLLLCFC